MRRDLTLQQWNTSNAHIRKLDAHESSAIQSIVKTEAEHLDQIRKYQNSKGEIKMFKIMKSLKLTVAVTTMLAMLAIAPVVHGGISWSGIDPIFFVKDHKFNVVIKWPEQYTCTIEDPIEVKVRVPEDSSYMFISESSDDVGDCGSPQRTVTRVKFVESNEKVKVKARLKSEFDFPFMVEVYLDGSLIATQMGESNRWTSDAEVRLPHTNENAEDDDDDDDDDNDDDDDDDD